MTSITCSASEYLAYVQRHQGKSVGRWVSIKAAEMAGQLSSPDL